MVRRASNPKKRVVFHPTTFPKAARKKAPITATSEVAAVAMAPVPAMARVPAMDLVVEEKATLPLTMLS